MIDITAKFQSTLDATGYLDIPTGEWICSGLLATRPVTIRSQSGVLHGDGGIGVNSPKGYAMSLTGLHLDGYDVGIQSSGTHVDSLAVESLVRDCRLRNIQYYGVLWDGPSDVMIDSVTSEMYNKLGGVDGKCGFYFGPGAGAVRATNLHPWGSMAYGIACLAPDASLSNCQSEGAKVALLALGAWRISVHRFIGFNPTPHAPAGVQLGFAPGDPNIPNGVDGYAAYCKVEGDVGRVSDSSDQWAGAFVHHPGTQDAERQSDNRCTLYCPAAASGPLLSGFFRPSDVTRMQFVGMGPSLATAQP